MTVYFFTNSSTLRKHLNKMDLSGLGIQVTKPKSVLEESKIIILLHISSIDNYQEIYKEFLNKENVTVGVASDIPDVNELISLNDWNLCCYINAYMAEIHYRQMIDMVFNNQRWINPGVLADALTLAKEASKKKSTHSKIVTFLKP